MKFTIEVETDDANIITKATVIDSPQSSGPIPLHKADVLDGVSWLVFSDEEREKMIVLSQLGF